MFKKNIVIYIYIYFNQAAKPSFPLLTFNFKGFGFPSSVVFPSHRGGQHRGEHVLVILASSHESQGARP